MVYVLYTIFFLSCIVLVAAVLLQPGKTDAGALFTSGTSSSAFAPRGTSTVLAKVTITAAVIFMLSGLLLSMPAFTGNVSVLSSNPEQASETANTNSNANANANTEALTAADANANASANTGTGDNSNGALIQTPATDEAQRKAANTAATGNPAGNSQTASATTNVAPAKNAAPAKSPAPKKK